VISGRAAATLDDGQVLEVKPVDIFYVVPGHDSWMEGVEPYLSLHRMGATDDARPR
jgi:uncharacterized cupin superfamily protein